MPVEARHLAYRFVKRVLSKEYFVLQLSGPCIGLVSSGIFRYLMITILCLGAPLPVRACSGLSGACLCPEEVVSSNVLVALGAAHYYLTWGVEYTHRYVTLPRPARFWLREILLRT